MRNEDTETVNSPIRMRQCETSTSKQCTDPKRKQQCETKMRKQEINQFSKSDTAKRREEPTNQIL